MYEHNSAEIKQIKERHSTDINTAIDCSKAPQPCAPIIPCFHLTEAGAGERGQSVLVFLCGL